MDYANEMQKCAFFESISFAKQILVDLRFSLILKPPVWKRFTSSNILQRGMSRVFSIAIYLVQLRDARINIENTDHGAWVVYNMETLYARREQIIKSMNLFTREHQIHEEQFIYSGLQKIIR